MTTVANMSIRDRMITIDMLDAVKVRFLKPIFEDDFPERGMTAWLTRVDVEPDGSYKLYFDFTEFESINEKYFTEQYYPNRHTGDDKAMYTALEANQYNPKYSVFFDSTFVFCAEIKDYLMVVTE